MYETHGEGGDLIKNQKGQILVIALILLALGSLLIVPTLQLTSTSLKSQGISESKMQELYSADSGIEYGIWCLENESIPKPYPINQNSVDISIEQISATIYKITSIAQSDRGSTTIIAHISQGIEFDSDNFTKIEDDFGTNDDVEYGDDIHVTGNLTTGDNSTFSGNAYIEGDGLLNDGSRLTGNLVCNSTVWIGDNCIIEGIICAPNIILADTAIVENDIFGSVSFKDESQILGTIHPLEFCPLCIDDCVKILTWNII